MQTAPPHIVLVGPMGAGKSVVGRLLAARLGRPFVDLDARVEAAAGATVAALFDRIGEAGFRALESRALLEALAGDPAVVATGGGAVLDAGNRDAMRRAGRVVYLQASPECQRARLAGDTARPLLRVADPAMRLADLQARREPLYREVAELLLDTSTSTPADLVEAVVEALGLAGAPA